MKVTITDVAKNAGVSIATVSHVINGTHKVSEATIDKVRDAIRRLGYVQNKTARNLKMGKKNVIGFIIPNISNSFFSTIAENMESILSKHGYNLIIANTKEDLEQEIKKIQLLSGLVDGFVIASAAQDFTMISPFIPDDCPLVFIDRKPKDCDSDIIVINNYRSTYESVMALIGLGHEKIGFISGSLSLSSMTERLRAYTDAMKNSPQGYHPEWIRYNQDIDSKASYYTQELINAGCTSIIASNNLYTMEAFSTAKSPGNIEKDIEISGFSDYNNYGFFENNISLVYQPSSEIGLLAAKQILYRIDHPELPVKEFVLSSSFLGRNRQ